MAFNGNYYGYGSKAEYVRYFAERGFTIAEIARTLGTTIVKLIAECGEIDIYRYRIFSCADGCTWSNEEIRVLIEHAEGHDPSWCGWHDLLPGRSTIAIRGCATRLGLYRKW